MTYHPPQEILDKYANVLINFALNSGEGIKPKQAVLLQVSECAKPMLVSLRRAVLKAGGYPLVHYIPDDISREYFELATEDQLTFFPEKMLHGRVEQIDHTVSIISETNKHELKGIDPKKLMLQAKTMKQYRKWLEAKENKGKFTWTLALYGTPAMAEEVGISEEAYWDQIIKACYLDEEDPVAKWKEITTELERLKTTLNGLAIKKVHVESEGTDLWVTLGKNRQWMAGSGRNIPSFEVFISPDWRGTEGKIAFNQPLYYYGNMIKGVTLKFKEGKVISATAAEGEDLLKEMIAQENADKIGEFSLTDGRMSRITQFMGETLFDENVGGEQGNTHVAVGNAYKDSYPGDPASVSEEEWKEWGYNESVVHTDIISTAKRKVTAYLPDGSEKVIYEDGKFLI